MKDKPLPLGKLPYALLGDMLDRFGARTDPRVVMGPRFGEDAAVIEMPDCYLVTKTDPVTFATEDIGWYAVNVNANDIATRGASPKWFMATVLLPESGATESLVESIFSQIRRACDDLNVTVVGGHTEVTHGLDRPIVSGCMLGEVAKDGLVTTSGAKPGDAVILTKGIVIEGTAIIAREKKAELCRLGYGEDYLKICADFLYTPGISVVKDALIAADVGVSAMHDPTEGGLAAGLYEIAEASGVGIHVDRRNIPLLMEAEILCGEYGLDPMGTLTSGTLLIAAPPENADSIGERLNTAGIRSAVIGEVRDRDYGLKIGAGGRETELAFSSRDEITRIFE